MAVSRAMRRLLRVRDIQEEQSKLALESAQGELNRLEQALAAAVDLGRRGRNLVIASARSGELPDRLAGIEETYAAARRAVALEPMIAEARREVGELRREFLIKRVERRQAETLIEENEARDAVVAERRVQQALDDWFRNRMHREGTEAGAERTAPVPATTRDEDATEKL
jgi:predicted GIY-YIG superfamily endonuclease